PGQTWLGATASFMAMWVVMMVAMMMPSLVPMLSCYRRAAGGTRLGTLLAGAGYFLVWSLVGACAYPLGVGLGAAAMRSAVAARSVPVAPGVVLVLAGCVQLTPWKLRQLACCRNPADCAPMRAEARAAWRYGLRIGARCSRCCSGLMAALLVAGVMDL